MWEYFIFFCRFMDGRERGVEVWVGLWVVLWGGGGLGQRMDDIMSRPLLCATVPRAHLLWRWWSGWHNSSRFLWPFRFPLLRFVVAVVAVVAVVVGSWHGSAVIYRRFQSDVAVGPVSFASVAPASSICCCCCCCCCCWSCVLVRFEIFHSCSTCSGCLLEPMFFFSVDAPDIVGTWMRCWWWRTWKMGKRIKRERERERERMRRWVGRSGGGVGRHSGHCCISFEESILSALIYEPMASIIIISRVTLRIAPSDTAPALWRQRPARRRQAQHPWLNPVKNSVKPIERSKRLLRNPFKPSEVK